MKKFYLIWIALLGIFFLSFDQTFAATITWDNEGADGLWSTASNWSTNAVPGASDDAVFDGTSNTASSIDAGFAGSVKSISLNSGYTNTVTVAKNVTIGTTGLTINSGTFDTQTYTVDVNDGSVTVAGGTLTGASGSISIERSLTHSSGSITGTKTVTFDGGYLDEGSLTCSGSFPYEVDVYKTDYRGSFTVAAGCTVGDIANWTDNVGAVTVDGTINATDAVPVSVGKFRVNGTVSLASATSFTAQASAPDAGFYNYGTVDFSAVSSFDLGGSNGTGDFFNNTGATVTINSAAAFTVEGDFQNDGTLNYGGTTITFDGGYTDNGVLTCTGTFPYEVDINKTDGRESFTLAAGCTVDNLASLAGNLASITVNGTINATDAVPISTGNFTVNGTVSLPNATTFITNANFTGSGFYNYGTVDFSSLTAFNLDGANGTGDFFNNTGSTVTIGSSAAFTVEGDFQNNGTLNFGGTTITFDGGYTDDGTLTCTGTFPYEVDLDKSDSRNTFTLAVGCTVDNIADWTGNLGSVVINGTINAADAVPISTGGFRVNGTVSLPNATTFTTNANSTLSGFNNYGTVDFSSITIFDLNGDGNGLIGAGNFYNDAAGTVTIGSSAAITVEGNFQNSGTLNFGGTTITFDGTYFDRSTLTCSGVFPYSVAVNHGTYANAYFNFSSSCTVNDFSFGGTGYYKEPTSPVTVTVLGDLSVTATQNDFSYPNLSFVLGGTGQAVSGTASFYNLTKDLNSGTDTLTFSSTASISVENNLVLQGTDVSNKLTLVSDVPTNDWSINPLGSVSAYYLNVQDSTNASSTEISCIDCTDSGRNVRWAFETSNQTPTVTSLGPAGYVNGSTGSSTAPTFSFTPADQDLGDTVQYEIQIDNSADFGTLIIDYLSGLFSPTATTFTVGQVAGDGNYITGSGGQALTEGSYYWRVKVGDDNYATSTYETANSGGIAFVVDTTPPDDGTIIFDSIATSTIQVSTETTGVTDYNFHESVTSSNSGVQVTSSWIHSSLTPNTEYIYSVTKRDAVGNATTTSGYATTTLAQPPVSVTFPSQTSTSATVAWDDNDNPAGTEYYVENITNSTNSGWITVLTWNSTGLTPGQSYDFEVKARNAGGIETAVASGTATILADIQTVTTSPASSVTTTTATLNGAITATGGENSTESGFAYGTSSDLSSVIATSTLGAQTGTASFTESISSLSPNTTYYVRAYSTNSAGTGYGTIESFTTDVAPITLTTSSASSITPTSVTLTGNISNTGGENATARGFHYGTSNSYGSTQSTSGSFSTGDFTENLTGLSCGTTYHYRFFATNSAGTTNGDDATFTTSDCPQSGSTARARSTVTPPSTPQTPDSPTIASLTQQLNNLKALLASLLGGETPQSPNTPPETPTFTKDLEEGMIDEEVRLLQKYLNSKGFTVATTGPGSPGVETNIFGPATKAALIKFQIANNITPAIGFFGPKTRGVAEGD